MNIIGNIFRLTTFGESHGSAIGGIIDGIPSGINVDIDLLHRELARRRPGQSPLTTSRDESDTVEILSGVYEGVTTGCPIGFLVHNNNQHTTDYNNLSDVLRPSHADYTYLAKYGIRDHRGGGRSSARETVSRVVAGAFAKMALRELGVNIVAYTSQVGALSLPRSYQHYDLSIIEDNAVRCPDPETAERMTQLIMQVKSEGDTIGGTVTGVITGCPVGLGSPVFGKLHAALGSAMLSINAAKGFEYGDGFAMAAMRGSEANDLFLPSEQHPYLTNTNHSGGIQGGISNGQDIVFRVAFKPVATILRPQDTIDVNGEPVTLNAHGRHDPCVVPRAVPIVESMAAITLLDHHLLNKTIHL